jgi:uncharacterized protein YbaA (DUF1428 family)
MKINGYGYSTAVLTNIKRSMQALKKYKIVILILVGWLCASAACLSAAENTSVWLNVPVTVRFQNESLNKVLGDISRQAGVVLFFDQALADKKVSGSYKDVKLSEAINRLFSEENKSIQVFRGEKKIIIKTFGAKKFVQAGTELPDQGDTVSQEEAEGEGMTLAELKKMHRQQYKEYKKRIADDNEVLEGGMTRGEVRAMQKKQYEEYKERIAAGNEVFEDGKTLREVKAMHKRQYEEYKERVAAGNEVFEDGKTLREVKAMHKRQYEKYKKRVAAGNEVFEDGKTLREVKAMHKRQYEEYSNRDAVD